MIAKIAVEAAVYAIDKPYSYLVPQTMKLEPGMRVVVPFGRGNRRTEGIVLALEPDMETTGTPLKCVEQQLDREAVLDEAGLRLAAFVRERYFCTFYEAIRAMLPAGLWFNAVERCTIDPDRDW